ncbi:ferrochelatase [Pelagibius sp.]|uniref:ferrochelatase n=1 Tax=Pelagibius sp. TaxID=1931238 RepID=UPI002620EA68|nr:ferrochelatase [Pelagibius sp.]
MSRIAVVVFNLGGPDRPDAVEPFLFNLFNDPAIIRLPGPLRWLLAKVISRRRAPVAQEIYRELGGGSPLLPNTEAQTRALQAKLAGDELAGAEDEWQVFIAMRYWHPRAAETAREVAAYGPDQVLLVPLYPQFSTTTSASSLREWEREARAAGITGPSRTLCCYPEDRGFVAATAKGLRAALRDLEHDTPPRVLFSAHGLPKKIVAQGDPYQWQVEQSVAAVVRAMGEVNLDWAVCYQSRVGPLEWIGPSTDAEIERAGREGRPVIVVPIAFVSEHSETLVELDIEYRKLAEEAGVPVYLRVPTVADDSEFIEGLAEQILHLRTAEQVLCSHIGGRFCPAQWAGCPHTRS